MKNKILLIQPQNLLHLHNYPPLGLICIGSALDAAGYDVKIIPTSRVKDYEDIIRREINETLLIGITTLTTEVPHAIEITQFIRNLSPQTPVVWGGWHTTLFPNHPVESGLVDYTIVGEGDELIVELANNLKNGQPPQERILRNKGYIDLNKLPKPKYELVMKIEEYMDDTLTDRFNEFLEYKIKWLPYESSRGCPHRCKFCINTAAKNQIYRRKNPEKVVDEIEFIIKKYGIDHFKIIDDNFFVDIKRVREICNKIIERKLKFTWDGECRVDYFREGFVDDTTLKLLTDAGLVQLTLGLESGSQQSLERMAKDITVQQSEHAMKQLEKYGILQRVSFVVDCPGETKDDLLETQRFVNRIRKYKRIELGMATYRPYPGTDFTDILIKEGFIQIPTSLIEWKDVKNVALWGIYDTIKPWQKNYKLSTNMAFYNSVESGVWLREHQAKNTLDKFIIRLFKHIAILRNRALFYHFTVDRDFYTRFRNKFYEKPMRQAGENT